MQAFIPVAGQWRVAGTMAGILYVGLDYVAVRMLWEELGIARSPALWRKLAIMEDAGRAVLNARK